MNKLKNLLIPLLSIFDKSANKVIEKVGTHVVLHPSRSLLIALLAGIVVAKASAAVSAVVLATGLFALLVHSIHSLKR